MNENLIHTEKQSNARNKILKFYGNNKVLIFSFLAFFIVFAVIFTFYIETNEKKKKIITENYITAKIYLENNERDKAKNILKEIVFTNKQLWQRPQGGEIERFINHTFTQRSFTNKGGDDISLVRLFEMHRNAGTHGKQCTLRSVRKKPFCVKMLTTADTLTYA